MCDVIMELPASVTHSLRSLLNSHMLTQYKGGYLTRKFYGKYPKAIKISCWLIKDFGESESEPCESYLILNITGRNRDDLFYCCCPVKCGT